MALSAGVIWRVRIGGSNTLCSGLFDPTIAGAGTDYTEQDTAQLALTDLASAAPYTTITSTTGGFTAAMVGNGIYISSGTGFTAGRYIITAVTDINTAVVDRACAASAASAGVAKLGGALATYSGFPAVAGNTIFIRGQGLNEPIDIDYVKVATTGVAGCTYIGYNGRPKLSHDGTLFHAVTNVVLINLYFVQTAGTTLGHGAIFGYGQSAAINCVFDQGGYDTRLAYDASLINCSLVNTGNQSAGTSKSVFSSGNATVVIKNCLIKDQKGSGVSCTTSRTVIDGCVIQNCSVNGIEITTASGNYAGEYGITNNTIYGNLGHGITIDAPAFFVSQNIIAAHTGSGKNGLYWSAAPVGYARDCARVAGNNFYGNTTDSNYSLSALDTALDPQFANAPVDLTPTNTALRVIGGVGAL